MNFNPRSPRGERPLPVATVAPLSGQFQSTLPARGATSYRISSSSRAGFQSTLPARGATCCHATGNKHLPISIHAPREGSDSSSSRAGKSKPISIHAPREGSDPLCPRTPKGLHNFNPRSPRGERRARALVKAREAEFQSTLPARGATSRSVLRCSTRSISIHAPREGSDCRQINACAMAGDISIHAPREGSDGIHSAPEGSGA